MDNLDNLHEQMNQWETPFSKGKDTSTAPSHKPQPSLRKQAEESALVSSPSAPPMAERNVVELQSYVANAQNAISVVDDVVMKKYLERLDKMNVHAPNNLSERDIVIFKVNLMVYEKDEYATDKFISAFSAMTFTENTVFLIVDGYGDRTDFYIGVRNNNPEFTTHSIAETFRCSFQGQFPGIELEDLSLIEKGKNYPKQHQILRKISSASTISSFAGIPSLKGENTYSNENFIQGIEKFSDAMKGKRYTAIIIARNQLPSSIDAMRRAYENIYSQLSCMASQQIAYSTNESLANAITRSRSTSDTISKSVSDGTSTTDTTSESHSTSKTKGTSKSTGESEQNACGKIGMLASPLISAGTILSMSGAGAAVGVPLIAIGGILSLSGAIGGKTKSKNETVNESDTVNDQTSTSHADGKTHNETIGNSHSESITDSEGNTSTVGASKNFTLTLHNKHIEELLKRIDKQLERIENAEGGGLWSTSAYFLSYDSDHSTAQIGAAIYRSIVQGDDSGIETSALNRWNVNAEKESNGQRLLSSLAVLDSPLFSYPDGMRGEITVDGTSLVSSKELSMMMGLPRKSVPGLPVVEHIVLGQEVIRYNGVTNNSGINLGVISDRGVECPHNLVNLDVKSLSQHVFVTGSTGCGKSETVYKLIDEAQEAGATFLVIEPAKGEYKDVFGKANVFGSNPLVTPLLRINPFRFPNGIHILEHIDRLTEIFNVCWPMYAAMPAVLKKAVLRAYEKCGWDLFTSANKYDMEAYPSFVDLLLELETAINDSAYSEEVKGNYIGSLVTRVESLTNGINGAIFSANEVPDEVLFDQNTIIDLSRIGSQETKSLIMGLLVMRLNEYRMVNAAQANSNLKHITVLEEAHNILQRTSTEQSMEGSNVTGKSVEMLINSIAEMRTYGEGFIIVDQSPTSVHASAIKNTNTKIIMRLPDGDDRLIAGKAAALKDEQVDEIAKLPTGVAIVYQNDWLQPVMCKISMSQTKREKYVKKTDFNLPSNELPMAELLKLLFKGRLRNPVEPQIDEIENALANAELSTAFRLELLSLISEYKKTGELKLWSDDNFASLSNLTARLLNLEKPVKEAVSKAVTFEDLNKMFTELLKKVKDLPASMDLTIKQALMRNYGEGNLEQLKIYNAWFQNLKGTILK